jgi:hypothetical protein
LADPAFLKAKNQLLENGSGVIVILQPCQNLNVKRLQCQIILRSLGARKPKGHKQDTKKSTEIA